MGSHLVRRALSLATVLAAVAMGGALVGCQPQTIVLATVQTDATSPLRPMQKLLVLGARMGENDRRAIEGGFATGLRDRGVAADPAFHVFPTPPRDRDQALATLTANGYDGVLIVALARVDDEQCGALGAENGAPCQHDRGGYMVNDRYVTIESTLWDLRGKNEIVWATGTETINPNDRDQLAASVSHVVVPELERAKFITLR